MNYYSACLPDVLQSFPAEAYSSMQFAAAAEILALQSKLMAEHAEYAAQRSPFYKNLFDKNGIDYHTLRSLNDLPRIPFTEKNDLIQYNRNFLAVADSDIADVCLTSATSGAVPTMMMQTPADLARLAYNEEIAFAMTGLTNKDTLVVCAALDRAFMAGLAYYLGGLKLRAKVIRAGSGNAAQHWQLIKVTGATAIVGVPSLMRKIAEYALANGDDPKAIGVQRLIAIGEALRDRDLHLLPLGQQVEELWGAHLYSTYASTEIATTFCECEARQGGHVRPELIVVEIIDENGKPLPAGEEGEIVATPLGVTGMPLLRFKTGDISFLIDEPCSCGRKTPRLGPILGRKQQMLKYKGTTVYPNAILSALESYPDYLCGYVEAQRNPDGTDRIILHLAVKEGAARLELIDNELRAKIRVVPEIVFSSIDEIERVVNQPEKKRKRMTFVDMR